MVIGARGAGRRDQGLPVESYLDLGDRCAFTNSAGALALHPDFGSGIWERDGCAGADSRRSGAGPGGARLWMQARLPGQAQLLRRSASDSPVRLSEASTNPDALVVGARPVASGRGALRAASQLK